MAGKNNKTRVTLPGSLADLVKDLQAGGADAGVLRRIGTAYKQTNQKLCHKSSFQAAHFQRTQCPSSIAFYFMVLKAFQKFHPITPDIKPSCSPERWWWTDCLGQASTNRSWAALPPWSNMSTKARPRS